MTQTLFLRSRDRNNSHDPTVVLLIAKQNIFTRELDQGRKLIFVLKQNRLNLDITIKQGRINFLIYFVILNMTILKSEQLCN